jgi:hypothetical protein
MQPAPRSGGIGWSLRGLRLIMGYQALPQIDRFTLSQALEVALAAFSETDVCTSH